MERIELHFNGFRRINYIYKHDKSIMLLLKCFKKSNTVNKSVSDE